ncbi:helix-turn-helix domain-containing protein [Nostoc sp.]
MSTGERNNNKVDLQMKIKIDVTPVASFRWNEENAQKLRQLREKAGYSRKALSEIVGISATYIQQLEAPHLFVNRPKKPKEVTVSTEILQKLCVALNGDVSSLIWDINCTVQ